MAVPKVKGLEAKISHHGRPAGQETHKSQSLKERTSARELSNHRKSLETTQSLYPSFPE